MSFNENRKIIFSIIITLVILSCGYLMYEMLFKNTHKNGESNVDILSEHVVIKNVTTTPYNEVKIHPSKRYQSFLS